MWLRVRRIPNYEKEEDGEKKTEMKAPDDILVYFEYWQKTRWLETSATELKQKTIHSERSASTRMIYGSQTA